MKPNELLKKKVQSAFKQKPMLHKAKISVLTEDGVVVLTGVVDNYHKKMEAKKTAKKVDGVKAVIEKIDVNSNNCNLVSDDEIAKKILKFFKKKFAIPDEKIKVKVNKGWITLDSSINFVSEKEIQKKTSFHLSGIIEM